MIGTQGGPRRILVLAPNAWGTGGVERSTRTLVRALAELYGPDRVRLLSVWGGAGAQPCRVWWAGPKVRAAVAVPAFVKVQFTAASVMGTWSWRRGLVIVACHPHLAPVGEACARMSGAPFITWCHGEEVWRPQRWSVTRALRAAHAVVTPSRFTACEVQRTAGVDPRRIIVMPHALPSELPLVPGLRRDRGGPPIVLSVARLVPEHRYKGIDTLLAAWPAVLDIVPRAQLLIAGDGADRPRLEAEARRLGLDGRVRFVGALDDAALARAYGQSAVFALPVRTAVGRHAAGEGFGLVYLEAAAAGLPVVAGNGGAIPEVVQDGETGFLVDPRAPGQVANAIVTLLNDSALATRMGRAGRQRALDQFSFERFRGRLTVLMNRVSERH